MTWDTGQTAQSLSGGERGLRSLAHKRPPWLRPHRVWGWPACEAGSRRPREDGGTACGRSRTESPPFSVRVLGEGPGTLVAALRLPREQLWL